MKRLISKYFKPTFEELVNDINDGKSKRIHKNNNAIHTIHNGSTLLIHAINNDKINIVETLINYGVDVFKKNYKGESPLFLSVKNTKIFKLILQKYTDPVILAHEVTDGLLFHIVETNKSELLVILANHAKKMGIKLADNGREIFDRPPALFEACKKGDLAMVQILLDCYFIPDINKKYKDRTPLSYTIESGNVNLVNFLIGKDAIC